MRVIDALNICMQAANLCRMQNETSARPVSAQQPETEGGGIPVTAEEMSELMYKPLPGEWGERSREEECDRIIAGIDRLITVGVCLAPQHLSLFHTSFIQVQFVAVDGVCNQVFWPFLQTNWDDVA